MGLAFQRSEYTVRTKHNANRFCRSSKGSLDRHTLRKADWWISVLSKTKRLSSDFVSKRSRV